MLPRARDPSATCESPTRSRASHPSRDPCSSTKHQRFPAPGKQQARSSQPCRDKHSWEQAASGGSALCQSKVSFAFSKLRSKTAALGAQHGSRWKPLVPGAHRESLRKA